MHTGFSPDMINLIDVFVGEVFSDYYENNRYLITNLKAPWKYTFQGLDIYDEFIGTWTDFKNKYLPKKRIGSLIGDDILVGDDWICHDGRCYPSVVEGGGCEFCQYYRMGSRQKKYYEPGDLVLVKSKREINEIVETSLFITKNSTPIKVCNLGYIPTESEFSVRFKTRAGTHYRWDELLEVKRKRHTINFHQLKYICEELCWYGEKKL